MGNPDRRAKKDRCGTADLGSPVKRKGYTSLSNVRL
jgi:hypothetical protein